MTGKDVYYRKILTGLQGMHRGLSPRLKVIGKSLPLGQRAALVAVATHGKLNITVLAGMLHITPGAATQHITALEGEGLLIREVDPADKRGVLVSMSQEGADYMAKLEQEMYRYLQEVFSEVDDNELKTFVRVLEKINAKTAAANRQYRVESK
jgi:DNA-binding MarR family transcriptional regulator